MKYAIQLLLTAMTVVTYGQDKYNYVHFNKLTEIKGTTYVVATLENLGKLFAMNGSCLVFINTQTGDARQIDFPKDSYLGKMEQIKIDSLGINRVVVAANTVNLNNNKSIDWNDPTQIIVLSADGKEKVQLTDDKFFTRIWTINYQTGAIVITGHYDTNNNGKYDKTDKNEIVIFDLKTLKLIAKI
jgi:hypothetical protein